MIGVRKMLDYVFTKEELKILDDILPEFSRREKLEIEEEIEKEVWNVDRPFLFRVILLFLVIFAISMNFVSDIFSKNVMYYFNSAYEKFASVFIFLLEV